MENLKITKENYEGYCELYKTFYFTEEENKELGKTTLKTFVVLLFTLIGLPILQAPVLVIGLSSIAALTLVGATFLKKCHDINKARKAELNKKYSNIDTNVTYSVLEKALEEANILKFNSEDKEDYILDIEGYRKYIEAEKIKNEIIEEYRFKPIYSGTDFDNKISDEELERAKVKVKKLR